MGQFDFGIRSSKRRLERWRRQVGKYPSRKAISFVSMKHMKHGEIILVHDLSVRNIAKKSQPDHIDVLESQY